MNDLAIRSARPDDAEAVFGLLTQFATSYPPQHEVFDRHYPILTANSQAVLLVATIDEQVVGYALGSIALTLYANGPVLELQELMVAPERRRRGIGKELVEAVLEQALAAGCIEATIPTRRARDFYVGLGFVESAIYLKRRLA